MIQARFWALLTLIAAAALARMIPHPPNFTPILGMALFAGATFTQRRWAWLLPLFAMVLTDAVLGWHQTWPAVYASIVAIYLLGLGLNKHRADGRFDRKVEAKIEGVTEAKPAPRWRSVVQLSFVSSVLFFVVTNMAVWLNSSLYAKSLSGLMTCFTLAVPFFPATLLSTLASSVILFAAWNWLEKRLPAPQTEHSH